MGCSGSCLQEDRLRKSGSGWSTPVTTIVDERVYELAGRNHESYSARVHDGTRRLGDDYILERSKVIGSGFSGPVRLGVSRLSNKKVAIKSFNKKILSGRRLDFLRNEVSVYLRLDHPNIARLLDVYEDRESVHLVMEFCAGKELYHRLVKKSRYSEADAAKTTYEMLIAINYLHQNQVVHRDIKLENFLYEDASESAKLKLIDFGFSKVWAQRERLQASCGSIQYVSPEVLRGDYDSQCDLWSLGVIVFMLLAGYPPFEGAQEEVLEKIRMGRYKMKENRWDRISSLGKDFVTKLLIVDPQERLTAGQALAHPWISQRALQEDVEVPREVLENIRIFAQFNHLKRAALSMLAYTLTSDQLSELHKVFLAMDLDKEGTIQLSELVVVMQTQLGLSPEEINDIFGKLDRSNQGKIEYTSFLAASMASRLQLHDDLIRHVFNQLDFDKDGFISLDDLRCVLGPTIDGQDVQVCIFEADINGDGRVNFDEFEKCFLPAVLEPKTSLAKLRAVSALSRVRSRRSLSCDSAISGVNV